jgi:hypothetical protein
MSTYQFPGISHAARRAATPAANHGIASERPRQAVTRLAAKMTVIEKSIP